MSQTSRVRKTSSPSLSANTKQGPIKAVQTGSPTIPTSKQGPLKAVQAFSLKQSSSKKSASFTSSPRENKRLLPPRKSPENRISPEQRSPKSGSPVHKDKTKLGSSTAPKWRPASVESVVPSYLSGQWPKLSNHQHYPASAVFMCDKSTQTVEASNHTHEKKKNHKRSASFGQGDQLKLHMIKQHLQKSKEDSSKQRNSPIQGNHSALSLTAPPSLVAQQTKAVLASIGLGTTTKMNRFQRNSVEGLNTEIEKLVSSFKSVNLSPRDLEDLGKLVKEQEIHDGRRAPGPEVCRLSSTRNVDTQTPSGQLTPSTEQSTLTGTSPATDRRTLEQMDIRTRPLSSHSHSSKGDTDTSPELNNMPSPRLVKSCPFVRQPPDGCEKVIAADEYRYPSIKEPLTFASLKPNEFEFKPSLDSAFCPLIKHY